MKRPAAAFLCACIACAAPAADGTGSFSIAIKPGGFGERCLKVPAGESIRYTFRADGPVDFNVHFHAGKDVHYPVRQAGVRESNGTFRAERTEDYCLMWEAKEAAAISGSVDRIR